MSSAEIEPGDDDQVAGVKLVFSLLAAVASAAPGGHGFLGAATAFGVSAAFLDYIQSMPLRSLGKIKTATDEAAATYGDPDKFMSRIAEDERLVWMFDSTVTAAAQAATAAKARTLGRALASGAMATDDAKIDEAARLLRIVTDLEPIDVRVLSLRAYVDADVMTDESFAASAGLSEVMLLSVFVTLDRNGLVNSRDAGSGLLSWWPVTDLGRAVLGFLVEAGAAPRPDTALGEHRSTDPR
jgi:hypothetical protein